MILGKILFTSSFNSSSNIVLNEINKLSEILRTTNLTDKLEQIKQAQAGELRMTNWLSQLGDPTFFLRRWGQKN